MRQQYWKVEASRCAGHWSIVAGLGVTAWMLVGRTLDPPAPTQTVAAVDARITEAVSARLLADPEIQTLQIRRNGIVLSTNVEMPATRATDVGRKGRPTRAGELRG